MDEPFQIQGARRSSSKGPQQDLQREEGSTSLIKSLETDLDDLRLLVTCRICIRPLYEPYTIACGHTFCYSCLRQWFGRDLAQKTCPDCRTKVVQQPAPAYLVSFTESLCSKPPLKLYRAGARHDSDLHKPAGAYA